MLGRTEECEWCDYVCDGLSVVLCAVCAVSARQLHALRGVHTAHRGLRLSAERRSSRLRERRSARRARAAERASSSCRWTKPSNRSPAASASRGKCATSARVLCWDVPKGDRPSRTRCQPRALRPSTGPAAWCPLGDAVTAEWKPR